MPQYISVNKHFLAQLNSMMEYLIQCVAVKGTVKHCRVL